MRHSKKLLILVVLALSLTSCSQSVSEVVDATQQVQEETTVVPTMTSTPTLTATPMPTEVPFVLDLDCGEFFCQQTWHGWLMRPFSEEYILRNDLTYPYASTMGDTLPPHHGVEFLNEFGTPVNAAQNGIVVFAGSDDLTVVGPYTSYYGNVAILLHTDLYDGHDVYTLYGHLSEILVTEGQEVAVGQTIGVVGFSGIATGPHLHFEVRLDENTYSASVNPMMWFAPLSDSTGGSTATLAGAIISHYGTPMHQFALTLERLDDEGNVIDASYPMTYYVEGTNSFPGLNENFVIPDLPPGNYKLSFIYNQLLVYFFALEAGTVGYINLLMQ